MEYDRRGEHALPGVLIPTEISLDARVVPAQEDILVAIPLYVECAETSDDLELRPGP